MITTFSIWYMKPDWFPHGILGEKPDPLNLHITHVHVKNLELNGGEAQLDRVYDTMQGEVWSPNGEARELILSLGLQHTSMSVGDVIIINYEQIFMVDGVGFKQLR